MLSEAGLQPSSEGRLDRALWAALLCALLREGRSGTLEMSFGRSWKRFDFILGVPVDYRSDREDDPSALLLLTAAEDGRPDALRNAVASSLDWGRGTWAWREAPALDPATIDPGLLPEPVTLSGLWAGVKQHLSMDEVMGLVTERGSFARADDFGEWFPMIGAEEPFDDLPAALAGGCALDVLYRRLPDRSGNLVKLLWLLDRAALFAGQFRQRVEMTTHLEGLSQGDTDAEIEIEDPGATGEVTAVDDEAIAAAMGGKAGASEPVVESSSEPGTDSGRRFGPPPERSKSTSYVHVGSPATGEVATIEPPASQEEATTLTAPAIEEPPSLGATVEVSLHDVADSVADEPAPTGAPPKKRDPAQIIRRDYNKRMGRNYYMFLRLESDAPLSHIEKRCRQLAGRWQAAQRSRAVPPEVKELAKELATGIQLVYRTLKDPKRRAEYDRRMAAGQAPILTPIRGASSLSGAPTPPAPVQDAYLTPRGGPTMLQRIQHFVQAGEWKLAAGLLKEARVADPSDPNVLAELGWVTWKLDKDRDAAEEFLKLAVAFDKKHLAATSYLGKLALDVEDHEAARKWLEKVMEIDRSQRWARRAIRKLPTPEAEQTSRGLKFWRKGD